MVNKMRLDNEDKRLINALLDEKEAIIKRRYKAKKAYLRLQKAIVMLKNVEVQCKKELSELTAIKIAEKFEIHPYHVRKHKVVEPKKESRPKHILKKFKQTDKQLGFQIPSMG